MNEGIHLRIGSNSVCRASIHILNICMFEIHMSQVLLIQMLPGELDMTFVKAFSSLSISVEGRSPITNPTENITKRRMPKKWMET